MLTNQNVGRLEQCPNCRSRRALRNIYRCGERHIFCEECAVKVLRGAMKVLTTTCPNCRNEAIETVGFIGQDVQQA
jgi:predicted Zn-ribbon and HTH transcriptional regulator